MFTGSISLFSPAAVAIGLIVGGAPGTNVDTARPASDGVAGPAKPNPASLALNTPVPAGTETASATTASATGGDLAGNCATAGPVTGLKVDRLASSITITAPAGTYSAGQLVTVAFACSDGGSGVATCVGTQSAGSLLNTLLTGSHSFVVDATDRVGNHSRLMATYTVAAPTCQGGGDGDGDHHRHG